MIAEQMYDLTIEQLDNGSWRLEQSSGAGEIAVVDLHPVQVRLLAERAGLLPAPDPKLLDRLGAADIRRLRALRERIDELYSTGYHDEILERCGYGLEISLHLRAIADLADDLLDGLDVTSGLPREGGAPAAPSTEIADPTVTRGVAEPAEQLTLT